MSVFTPNPPANNPPGFDRPYMPNFPTIPHMPVRGNASVHSIEHHESNIVGVGENVHVVKEDFIYVDSSLATKKADGTYTVKLDPPVQSNGIERNYIYLKQFSCLNTIPNIDASPFEIIDSTRVPPNFPRSFDIGAFNSVKDLVAALNEKFCPKDGGSTVPASDPNDGGEQVPFVQFEYDSSTCLVTATQLQQNPIGFDGEIFDLLKLAEVPGVLYQWKSTEPVDIFRAISNIYVSCDQIVDAHTSTSANIPNRLIKMTNYTDYGNYLQYEAMLPVQPKELEPKVVNTLDIRLFNNDGLTFTPDRFLMTLCRQLRKPVVNHKESYWVEDTKNTLLKEDYESRKPPIRRYLPNDNCPDSYATYL